MSAAASLALARKAKARKRRERASAAERDLRSIDARYRDACRDYNVAIQTHGDGSPEEREAWAKLRPIEAEWARAAMEADRAGVAL